MNADTLAVLNKLSRPGVSLVWRDYPEFKFSGVYIEGAEHSELVDAQVYATLVAQGFVTCAEQTASKRVYEINLFGFEALAAAEKEGVEDGTH